MKRHIHSKITFSDPYVVRSIIQDPQRGMTEGLPFFATLQRAKNIYTEATWAYSTPDYETVYLPKDEFAAKLIVNGHITSYYPSTKSEYTAYWAFKDEQDALQFRLLFGEHVKRVHMWDNRIRFTVIEHE